MSHKQNLKICTNILRQNHREYLLYALRAPPKLHTPLIALYLLKAEWEKIEKNTTEPIIKHIKQKWWFDTLTQTAQNHIKNIPNTAEHPLIPLIAPHAGDIVQNGLNTLIESSHQTPIEAHSANIHIHAAFIEMAAAILDKNNLSPHIRNLAQNAARIIAAAHHLATITQASDKEKSILREAQHMLHKIRQQTATIPDSLFPAFFPLSAAILRLDIIEKRCQTKPQNKKDLGAFFPLRLQWRLHRAAKKKQF